MKKKMIAMVLALAMILSLSVSVLAAAPVIKEAEYEGRGFVEVEFTGKVQYKNVKVTVKDSAGSVMTAVITEKDSDDLTFHVKGLKPGAKYTYTISGVRAGRSGKYQSVSGSFMVPKWDPLIKEIDYDAKDKELEIDFVKRVQYKGLKVTIKDAKGNTVRCRIDEKDAKGIELVIPGGLKTGARYTLTISGIRPCGNGSYTTVTGVFTAK